MRINKMITKEMILIFYQIILTHPLRKSMKTSLENLYVDIGTKRVNKVLALNPCQDNKSNDAKVLYQRCQKVPRTSVRPCYGEFRQV